MLKLYSRFLAKSSIEGLFTNVNYVISVIAEVSNVSDTICLLFGNVFKSNYYGNGTYEISRSISGTVVSWTYEEGQVRYSATISRSIFRNLRIEINPDLNYFYEKVEFEEKTKI